MTEELRDKELTDIKYLRARMTGDFGLALDHAYNLGFFDGKKSVADKIRAEIEKRKEGDYACFDDDEMQIFIAGLNTAIDIIDKYKAEGSNKE